MIDTIGLHNTGEGLQGIAWTHYLKSGSQDIHILKRFACNDLLHVNLSSQTTCIQLEICLYSPLLIDKMNFQSERYQWHV